MVPYWRGWGGEKNGSMKCDSIITVGQYTAIKKKKKGDFMNQ